MTDWKRLQSSLPVLGLSAIGLITLLLFDAPGWLIALAAIALLAFVLMKAPFFTQVTAVEPSAQPAPVPADKSIIDAFIQSLPDPCLLLDRRGAIVAFNRRAANLAPDLRKGSALSLHMRWPALNDAVALALSGKTSCVDIEEKVPVDRWSSFFVTPLDLSGSGDHVCIIVHDRTEQKRTERMRVDFIANASHELRTPLASLLGFVETLQGPARNDEKSREHFLDIMQLQAKRMSRLIDDLLSLSRIEMHAHIQPETQLDLASLLQSTLDSLRPLAEHRKVTLNFNKPPTGLSVRGDRDELFRAFENLIENAIKYGESGKKVDIEMTSADGMIRTAIRDYGPGIEEEHLPRLTERFYRVDAASSREKGGTGLGLAIVKHIINRHRGSLEIGSKPGQGSVFTVLLPQAA